MFLDPKGFALTGLSLLAVQGVTLGQVRYTVTDLGVLPGFDQGQAYGISATGAIVGQCYDVTLNRTHAFKYENGVMTDLGTLSGGNTSTAVAVNSAGRVVGRSEFRNAAGHSFYFGYQHDGAMTALTTLPERNTTARDLNEAGVVVGAGLFDYFKPTQAAVWTSPTVVLNLGGLIPDGGSDAYGVNDAGLVVGEATTFDGLSYWSHAFVWDGVAMLDLGTFAGPTGYSRATDVNDLNHVVGWAENRPASESFAFLWTGGALIGLGGLLPTSQLSAAYGINNHGQIVGSGNTADIHWHAILWEGGTTHDLNDLLPAGHGWKLVSAEAVNDAGRIVGYGYPPAGPWLHAFLLEPVRFQWSNAAGKLTRRP